MPFVNDPGDWSQVLESLAEDHAPEQFDLQNTRCPRCNRFGVVAGIDDYYGIIYKCNCFPVFWVINPETGEKLEGG